MNIISTQNLSKLATTETRHQFMKVKDNMDFDATIEV